ncbi:MAG: hypothetical protein ACRDH5_11695 [bacterium]
MAKVTLNHAKGVFTLGEVDRLCRACGIPQGASFRDKGIWTQKEVALELKGHGHRVFAGETGGQAFSVATEPEPSRKARARAVPQEEVKHGG